MTNVEVDGNVRSEVLIAVSVKRTVFWDLVSRSQADVCRRAERRTRRHMPENNNHQK
jgi:hypothetical protein